MLDPNLGLRLLEEALAVLEGVQPVLKHQLLVVSQLAVR